MSLHYKFRAEDLILNERTTKENISAIKKWLDRLEEKFVPRKLPDEMIVLFLISCDNNVKAVKDSVVLYFQLKKCAPELYDNRNVYSESMEMLMDIWSVATLPTRTRNNYAIHMFKLEDCDYKKFDAVALLKVTVMLVDITIDRKNPPDGLIVVIDMKEAGLMHLTKINLDLCKKYFSFLQAAVPIKLTAIHYMNSNFVVNKMFGILKSFIKSDVFDKIHFHPPSLDLEKFYEYIPKECLTKDFGGDLPYLQDLHDVTRQQFVDKQEFWDSEEQFRKKWH